MRIVTNEIKTDRIIKMRVGRMPEDIFNEINKENKNAINDTINSYDVYLNERKNSNKFRIVVDINPFCSNVLFNPFTEIVKDEKGKESYVIRDFLIKDIIKSVLHELCFEPLHNIVINDLDEYGVELLEYRGDEPMYLLRKEGPDREFTNLTFNADNEAWEYNGQVVSLKALEEIQDFKFDNLSELNNENPSTISYNGRNYYVAKVTYG